MTTLSSITSQIGLIPSGCVLPFAGTTAPAGWVLCDGSILSETAYPSLFSAIGSTYNTQTNPTTNSAYSSPGAGNFRVPDYRASFLRGTGTPFAGDAVTLGGWQVQKTAKNGLTASVSGTNGTSAVTGITGTNLSSSISGTAAVTGSATLTSHGHGIGDSNGTGGVGWQFDAAGANYYASTVASGAKAQAKTNNTNIDHSHTVSGTATAQAWSQTGSGTAAAQAWSGTATIGAGDNETRPHNKGVNFIIKL